MLNPINFVARFVITRVVRYVNIPLIFANISIRLCNISRFLINTHGFIPTMTALYQLNRTIRNHEPLMDFSSNNRLNPCVAQSITDVVYGHWGGLLPD